MVPDFSTQKTKRNTKASEETFLRLIPRADKMYRSKVCVQEFWYFVPGLDIQPEISENDNPVYKKAVARCETLKVIYRFFQQTDTNPWLSV